MPNQLFQNRRYLYRTIVRADRGGKSRVAIQRFCWWRLFYRPWAMWVDWYPVENAVRDLEHEVIELYDRLDYILCHEHKEAEAWVKSVQEQVERSSLHTGKGIPYWDKAQPYSPLMPDPNDRFKQIVGLVRKGFGQQTQHHRTAYVGTSFLKRFDKTRFDRDKIAEEMGFSTAMEYHPPKQNQNQNQNQKQKGQQNQKQNQDPGSKFSFEQ